MASWQADLNLYAEEIADHRKWFRSFAPTHREKWEQILNDATEAAIVEACVRRLLTGHAERIEPGEDLEAGGKGPDFVCYQGPNRFYVEATCLTRDTVTQITSLPPSGDPKAQKRARMYGSLVPGLFHKCTRKAPQCGGLDAPCLLAVGTLHFQGGSVCFEKRHLEEVLTGQTYITGLVDTRTGEPIGKLYEATRFDKAAFVRPNQGGGLLYELARKSIAGLLCCAFGSSRPKVNGILHPGAARPFDPDVLAGITFGKLRVDDNDGALSVVWG